MLDLVWLFPMQLNVVVILFGFFVLQSVYWLLYFVELSGLPYLSDNENPLTLIFLTIGDNNLYFFFFKPQRLLVIKCSF